MTLRDTNRQVLRDYKDLFARFRVVMAELIAKRQRVVELDGIVAAQQQDNDALQQSVADLEGVVTAQQKQITTLETANAEFNEWKNDPEWLPLWNEYLQMKEEVEAEDSTP